MVKLITVCLILGVLSVAPILNYAGYCIPQYRFLSVDELFLSAIRDGATVIFHEDIYEYKDGIGTVRQEFSSGDTFESFISDRIINFQRNNPNCCYIVESPEDFINEGWEFPSLTGRLFGSQRATISVSYFGRFTRGGSDEVASKQTLYAIVGNCGTIYKVP
ncbi:hypothetical protein [Polycladidibacter stylochi]|uniref:hypothetical protein n=1 Tax=Polycladidibacter stylochi TaxID=1807766 RepID=UPI00083526AA|nr:hypothetical protein [Pseudovibrio stylochi]